MEPPGADTVLVRHGEIGTKSAQVQARMERQLANNLRAMLSWRDIPATVSHSRGRLFIETTESMIETATTVARQTAGVISASPAITVEPTEAAIYRALRRSARTHYDGGTFAVRARRVGERETHPFTSADLEERGGSEIWDTVSASISPKVDLTDPDYTFYVECREQAAYIFLQKLSGMGGFPVGTQGKTIALISGGIDSPVAAWEMLRRGCEIIPLYFDFEDYGGPDHVARALESVRNLASYSPSGALPLYRIPIGEAAHELIEHIDATRMLSLRRLMVSAGETIAAAEGAHSLTMGESIGQKSSQTGWNLAVTDATIDLPIHRPLLDRDKHDIIEQAKELDTFTTATIPAGCNRVAPSYPETRATIEQVEAAEPAGLFDYVEAMIDAAEYRTVTATTRESSQQETQVQGSAR